MGNLVVGDAFNIGGTPIVITEVAGSRDFRATHKELSFMTMYTDGGHSVRGTMVMPTKFLVELIETESKEDNP